MEGDTSFVVNADQIEPAGLVRGEGEADLVTQQPTAEPACAGNVDGFGLLLLCRRFTRGLSLCARGNLRRQTQENHCLSTASCVNRSATAITRRHVYRSRNARSGKSLPGLPRQNQQYTDQLGLGHP